jgi:hypothetical protein
MNWWPDDDVKVALANYGSAYIDSGANKSPRLYQWVLLLRRL